MKFNPLTSKFDLDTPPTIGKPVKSGISGSVLFVDSSGKLAQDNSQLFWDDTNNRLGIGTASLGAKLQVDTGATTVIGTIIKGAASQTANLQEWRDSTGTVLSNITNLGVINVNTADVVVTNKNQYRPLLNYAGDTIARYQDFVWNGSDYVANNGYGFGFNALRNNTGTQSNGFGYLALYNNTGANSNGFGYAALYNNTGANSNGFGSNALYSNNWANAIGIGHQSTSYFLPDATTDKSFAYADVNGTAHTITFSSAHGFGTVGGKVNLQFTLTTGTAPTGLVNGTIYQFTVTSTTVLTYASMTSQGSADFTGKLTNSVDITNSIAIGTDVNASKANQVVLGNSSVVETLLNGNVGVGTTSPFAKLSVTNSTATTIAQIIKGAASQSANLTEWLDSAGNVLASVSPAGKIVHTVPTTLKGYTVATLPAGVQGDMAFVTDATTPTYLGTLTGGGSVVTPVFFDGTNWISH